MRPGVLMANWSALVASTATFSGFASVSVVSSKPCWSVVLAATSFWSTHTRTMIPAIGSPLRRLTTKLISRPGAAFGDDRDLGDDDDGVGAQRAIGRLDQVHALVAHRDRDVLALPLLMRRAPSSSRPKPPAVD